MIYENGSKVTGDWRDDKLNGSAIMIYPNKDKYEG
jgi:hypothetical protein